MWSLTYVGLAGILLLVAVLLAWSYPGKPKPFVDQNGRPLVGSLSEKLAYDYMLEKFKANGHTNMVRKLEAAPVTMTGGIPHAYLALRDGAMHRLGISTTHEMKSVLTGIFLPSLQCHDYTLGEKINLWRGKATYGIASLWDEMITTDLGEQVLEFQLPVYLFHGIYDYTCNYSLTKDYFDKLSAPVKGFYTFEHSAHSLLFEEPDKYLKILQEDVLSGESNLADR